MQFVPQMKIQESADYFLNITEDFFFQKLYVCISVTCQTYKFFQYHNSFFSLCFFIQISKDLCVSSPTITTKPSHFHSKMSLLKSQNNCVVSNSSTKQGYINWQAFVSLTTASRKEKKGNFLNKQTFATERPIAMGSHPMEQNGNSTAEGLTQDQEAHIQRRRYCVNGKLSLTQSSVCIHSSMEHLSSPKQHRQGRNLFAQRTILSNTLWSN